ncbi:hypothetical protein [Tenacibaculum maritimum]|uniref:hypothetical protein n=1 Tax=Tenacibaculum maritimum TaxID=107401 RepID=UPI00132FE42D|nr:hypothetical protein [Tenacibaculum maritimum]
MISYSTGKEIIFNESECIKIRKSLIEFRKELEEINSKIQPTQVQADLKFARDS